MTDRETIQSALQQVQAGEITPEEATLLLIAAENAETLDSLIERLGTPPRDIVDSWCDQLRSVASSHEAESGNPLPEIKLDQWAITTDGDLLLRGRRYKISDDGPRASPASLDRIQSFQRHLTSEHQVKSKRWSALVASQFPSKRSASSSKAADDSRNLSEKKAKRDSSGRQTRAVAIAGIAVCAIAAGFILFRVARSTNDSIAQNSVAVKTEQAAPLPASVPTDPPNSGTDLRTAETDGSEASGETVTLETFELPPELESDLELDIELSMSLDGLVPLLDDPEVSDPESSPPESESNDSSDEENISNTDRSNVASTSDAKQESTGPSASQIADDEPVPTESPQQTRQSTVMSVKLANADDIDTVVALSDSPMSGLKVDFPYEVPLEVKEQDDVWSIHDARKDVSLAVIRAAADGTELSWSNTAKQSPNVSALAHGRLTDGAGNTIFLRPTIESDPWSFGFEKSDVMPTWNLGDPIPPKVTNLEVQFHLPEDIEFGWVDPIDPGKLRRTRGTAVINTAGDEEVSLGIRFDIRCNRKLACRMRFAARLDPSMSWQIVSTPLLAQFSSQLTQRSTAISKEGERLAKVYRSLDRRAAKRFIRNKQDHVKDLAAQAETAAQRVAKLQTLLARLESQATIGFRVWVEWPDTEQTLLLAVKPTEN